MKSRLISYTLQLIHAGSAVYGYFWLNENLQYVAKFLTIASIGLAMFTTLVVGVLALALTAEKADKKTLLAPISERPLHSLFTHHLSSLAVIVAFAWFGHLACATIAVVEWAVVCMNRFVINRILEEETDEEKAKDERKDVKFNY